MSEFIGPLAALGTAICWAGSALFFEAAGKGIGSLSVNLLRLPIAFALLVLVNTFYGRPLPVDADAATWGWLGISGAIGFVIGDMCLFRAFLLIGPRLSSLIMASTPLFAALIGAVFLGERLGPIHLVGMVLTTLGIVWALSDRTPHPGRTVTPWGIALAFAGALGQAGGLAAAKHGMGNFDPISATQIRILAGFVGFSLIFTGAGLWPRAVSALKKKRPMLYLAGGAFCGPFLGVALSLISVQKTQVGIAASIMAITPIILIPIVVVFYGERVGRGGVLGTIVAVGGVVLLFQS